VVVLTQVHQADITNLWHVRIHTLHNSSDDENDDDDDGGGDDDNYHCHYHYHHHITTATATTNIIIVIISTFSSSSTSSCSPSSYYIPLLQGLMGLWPVPLLIIIFILCVTGPHFDVICLFYW
jgi:hypothetical protein